MEAVVTKEQNRNQLLSIIRTQQLEILALQRRVEGLEAEDIGELRRQVLELEKWKNQAEGRIRELEAKSAMTQGLAVFVGTSAVALVMEKVIEALKTIPLDDFEQKLNEMGEEQLEEFEKHFGDFPTKLIEMIHRLDSVSLQAWERQRKILERRAATLPPLKRAMYHALNRFAAPSKVGAQLLDMMLTNEELAEKLTDEDKRKLELFVPIIDTFSNLWPLTITNSLTPMLKHVGFDDAAEAAGEILDQLETTGNIPRHLIQKVRPDLVVMEAIEKHTKPSTIIQYLSDGFKLEQLGCSPDEAASFGWIPNSATHLKRAKRVYEGLNALYDRVNDYPDNIYLDHLETFGQSLKRAAEEKVIELRDLVAAELN